MRKRPSKRESRARRAWSSKAQKPVAGVKETQVASVVPGVRLVLAGRWRLLDITKQTFKLSNLAELLGEQPGSGKRRSGAGLLSLPVK